MKLTNKKKRSFQPITSAVDPLMALHMSRERDQRNRAQAHAAETRASGRNDYANAIKRILKPFGVKSDMTYINKLKDGLRLKIDGDKLPEGADPQAILDAAIQYGEEQGLDVSGYLKETGRRFPHIMITVPRFSYANSQPSVRFDTKFLKYYDQMDDKELANAIGCSPADIIESDADIAMAHYGTVVSHLYAKDEYGEPLADYGIDILDILHDGTIGYPLGEAQGQATRFYGVDIETVERVIDEYEG